MKPFLYFCLAGWLLLPLENIAQSGSLDLTFGSGGKRIENFGVAGSEVVRLVALPDGKILVGGYAHFTSTATDFVLARFLADGTPDATFGVNGRVVTNAGPDNSDDEMQALVVLPSGKILVAGSGSQNVLVRYNSDGSLDNSFNGNGILPITFPSTFALADIQVQNDGKIIMLGDAMGVDFSRELMVQRRNSDGSLDITFDGDGIVSIGIDDTYLFGSSLGLQSDGKIVLAGVQVAMYAYEQSYLIFRLNGNGSVDNSFGGIMGFGTVDPGAEWDELTDLQVLPNDQILLGGFGINPGGAYSYTSVTRLLANGAIDNSFSGNGTRLLNTGGGFFSVGRLQNDGDKIILSGIMRNSNNMYSLAFLRLNNDGSNDNSFGTGGIATLAPGTYSQLGVLIARQADGKYLAGGYFSNGKYYQAGMARISSAGVPDNSFGGDAIVEFLMGNANGNDRATSLQVFANDRFVVGGEYENGIGRFGFVQQYLPDGTPDASFGTNGRVNLPASFAGTVNGVLEVAGGKLVVLGTYFDIINGQSLVLYRLNPNGTIDPSFGVDGLLVWDIQPGTADYGISLGKQSDGKIIVLAIRATDAGEIPYLFRFTADGSTDPTFNTNGWVQISNLKIEFTDYSGYNQRLLIQPDDRIVVTGFVEGSSNENVGLRRYTANGALDVTFNGGNPVSTDLGNDESGIAVVQQPDGKLVVAAKSTNYFADEFKTALLRYNSNGTPDNSFDGDGWLLMPGVAPNRGNPTAVRVLPNGQLLAAGTVLSPYYTSIMVVARLNENGSFDAEFGTAGIATITPSGNNRDVVFDMQLQSTGKILLVGKVENNADEDVVLVRLNQTIPTSVTDRSLPLATLRVAPNPVHDQVTLSAQQLESGHYQLRVFTASGRLVDSRMFTINGGSLNWNVDASTWPNGLLLLTITGRNSQKTFRVVKQ